jgi:hypothetical protein
MRIILLFAALIWCTPALAWDPQPYPVSIEQMVSSAQCVFVGFVNKVFVARKTGDGIESVAEIEIVRCLRGRECKSGQTMRIAFLNQTVRDVRIPISFKVAEEVIMALKSECSKRYKFDVIVHRGHKPDAGYTCDVFPGSIVRRLDPSESFSCTDIMFNMAVNDLTYGRIEAMLKSGK